MQFHDDSSSAMTPPVSTRSRTGNALIVTPPSRGVDAQRTLSLSSRHGFQQCTVFVGAAPHKRPSDQTMTPLHKARVKALRVRPVSHPKIRAGAHIADRAHWEGGRP